MECEFCKKLFSSKGNLKVHQKKTKSCLNVQNKNPEKKYDCLYCSKSFILKDTYHRHTAIHISNPIFIKLQKTEEDNIKLKEDNIKLTEELEIKEQEIKELKDEIRELKDENYKKLEKENLDNKKKISNMTKRYVKKQARIQYTELNVIYILTTESHKKNRLYIFGKAENLTNRLATYNKTEEHEVVYYQECMDANIMSIVESLVFHKLKEYRQQANRERFILPEEESIEMFIDVIKQCIDKCK